MPLSLSLSRSLFAQGSILFLIVLLARSLLKQIFHQPRKRDKGVTKKIANKPWGKWKKRRKEKNSLCNRLFHLIQALQFICSAEGCVFGGLRKGILVERVSLWGLFESVLKFFELLIV